MANEETDIQPIIKNRYAKTHPVIFHMKVRGTDIHTFTQTVENDNIAKIIGASPQAGLINVTLAVLDDDVAEMIEDAFGA